MNLFDLKGKKAIVTGGSRGLGKGMAEALHQVGVELVIMGTNPRVLEVATLMDTKEARVYGVISDFRSKSEVEKGFFEAINHLGNIDILVNNAGHQIRHACEDFPLKDWEEILSINLTSAFILCQLAGGYMLKKGGGKIINIASLLSFSGGYRVPAYAASKGGIAQLTKALSNEWASRGINVNAIAPGYMDTDNTKEIKENEIRSRQILERIPAGRWGTPEDMAGALIFLASGASDYVHGSIITVDGGWMGR
jgi:2-deoxy-D-gluconate 3-dehydrogenase